MMARTMLAARVLAPGRVAVEETAIPEPSHGQLLVRVLRASICGSDVHRVYGGFDVDMLPAGPGWPGHEGIGIVERGHNDELGPGDLALLLPGAVDNGTYAEWMVISAAEVIRADSARPVEESLMAQQLGTTIFALKRFWPEPGAGTAAVIGAGSAGLYFVQLLRRHGFDRVIVAEPDARRREAASALGADLVVDGRPTALTDAIADLTAGAGVDLAVEAAGTRAARDRAIEITRKFGRVGFFGHAERPGEDAFGFEPAWVKCLDVRFAVGAMFEPGLASFREAQRLLAAGEVRIDHLGGHEYSLREAPRALAAARDRESIKIHFAIAGR
jgi:L-iditol 2-dehydrogenase